MESVRKLTPLDVKILDEGLKKYDVLKNKMPLVADSPCGVCCGSVACGIACGKISNNIKAKSRAASQLNCGYPPSGGAEPCSCKAHMEGNKPAPRALRLA